MNFVTIFSYIVCSLIGNYLNLAPIGEEIERNHLGFLLLLGLRNDKPIMRRYPDGKTQETKYQEKV
jgi:hypothetical protein